MMLRVFGVFGVFGVSVTRSAPAPTLSAREPPGLSPSRHQAQRLRATELSASGRWAGPGGASSPPAEDDEDPPTTGQRPRAQAHRLRVTPAQPEDADLPDDRSAPASRWAHRLRVTALSVCAWHGDARAESVDLAARPLLTTYRRLGRPAGLSARRPPGLSVCASPDSAPAPGVSARAWRGDAWTGVRLPGSARPAADDVQEPGPAAGLSACASGISAHAPRLSACASGGRPRRSC